MKTSQRLGHAFSDKSGHLSFLKESLEFLDKVKTSHSVELPCIFGWKFCIQSLLGLWEYLKTEQSFQFILTSRINQDCVENLFSIIHGFGGHRDNPDVEQLKSSFKYVVADKLLVQVMQVTTKLIMTKFYLMSATLQWQNMYGQSQQV